MTRAVPAAEPGNLAVCLERIEYARAFRRELLMEKESSVPYTQPLTDAMRLFEELGIGYALVGGVASMYYGRARPTEDVDFVVVSEHQEVLAAHPEVMRKHGFDPTCTYKLYHSSGIEIDIWKDEFTDAIVARAPILTLGKLQVRIAEVHDLVAMKLRAGRIQDDYDVSEILKRGHLDLDLLQTLVTREQFAHFQAISARSS
jgi:hypothetical protein